MATRQLRRVLQTLRGASFPHEGEDRTDGQLLESYVHSRDEAAFAALVRRHGPMVWGVCRRLLRSHHDAEDAYQATFLVLVRKAASVVPRALVAGWLHGVARHVALKVQATTARRQGREKQVTAMPEPAVEPRELWDDLRPLLDQELDRLPEKYRSVLVLFDLEGKTRKETARHLRLPEDTVATRLATARAMLARRLSRRGLTVTGGTLGVVLSQHAVSAGVPPAVVSTTIQAATAFAAGQAAASGMLSVKAVALTEGVLKTMLLSKLKIATAVLLAVVVLGAGAAGLTQNVLADPLAGQKAELPTGARVTPGQVDPMPADNAPGEGPQVVDGLVQAVDAEKNTLTFAYKHRPGQPEKTVAVAKDAPISIDGKPGKLAGVPPGAFVNLGLSVDQKVVRSLEAGGGSYSGVVKAVDAEKNTITIDIINAGGEKTFPVAKDANIDIDGKPGKLADVPREAGISLSLSVDQTVRTIQAKAP
jgi:RNA polymerase sigma factor (sigma-70 family)